MICKCVSFSFIKSSSLSFMCALEYINYCWALFSGYTIFKETEMGRWVHLVCALYIPGVAFSEVTACVIYICYRSIPFHTQI